LVSQSTRDIPAQPTTNIYANPLEFTAQLFGSAVNIPVNESGEDINVNTH
jgi:hypothetical protein